jgi:hypothetical protein
MLDGQCAAQADNILGGVTALDAFPSGIFSPVFLQGCNLCFAVGHD